MISGDNPLIFNDLKVSIILCTGALPYGNPEMPKCRIYIFPFQLREFNYNFQSMMQNPKNAPCNAFS